MSARGFDESLAILVAEDNEDDAAILKKALQRAGFSNPVHICPNGTEAIRYLQGESLFADRKQFPFPRLLVTDLKMPGMDGFQLLDWIQSHPEFNVVPRVVLSTSDNSNDVTRAYQLGANSYLLKPATFEELTANLQLALAYWKMCLKPVPPSQP
jgi:CheY-like chemotaxis protein